MLAVPFYSVLCVCLCPAWLSKHQVPGRHRLSAVPFCQSARSWIAKLVSPVSLVCYAAHIYMQLPAAMCRPPVYARGALFDIYYLYMQLPGWPHASRRQQPCLCHIVS
jgi:hypothetical protein